MNPTEITLASRIESIELRRDVSKRYVGRLRYAVNKFGRWLERAPTVAYLHADTVNRWLLYLGESLHHSRHAIRRYWLCLRAIWFDAFKEGLTDDPLRCLLEFASPSAATRHLEHLAPDLLTKHYLDHAQIDRSKPLPPALPGQEGGQR